VHFVTFMSRVLAVALAVAPMVAHAAQDSAEAARTSFEAGQSAYDAGRYDEALKHFMEAYRLNHDAALLFSVGECHRRLKNYAKARVYYQRYLSELPSAPYAALVLDLIKEMETLAPHKAAQPKPRPAEPVAAPTPPSPPTEPAVAPPVEPKPAAPKPPDEASLAKATPDVPLAPAPAVTEPAAALPISSEVVKPPPPPNDSLLGKWWFWTAVAVVVVGAGATSGYLATRSGGRDPSLGTVQAK
jgi:hypothetical protein